VQSARFSVKAFWLALLSKDRALYWASTQYLSRLYTYQRMTNGVEALHGDSHQRPSGHADGNSCDEKTSKINKSTINQ